MSKTISNVLSLTELKKYKINKKDIKGLTLTDIKKLQKAIDNHYRTVAPGGAPFTLFPAILGPALMPATKRPAKKTSTPKRAK
jgi:hypothetical protein